MLTKLVKEKDLHFIFEASLVAKGAFALSEIIGGAFIYFVSQQFLIDLVRMITQDELAEDSKDFIANNLLRAAQNLSVSAQHFTAFYLLSHGVLKLWLILGLARKKIWYYPLAMIIFGLFITYQMYRFSFTRSPLLLLITVLDLVVIWLTWREYKFLKDAKSR